MSADLPGAENDFPPVAERTLTVLEANVRFLASELEACRKATPPPLVQAVLNAARAVVVLSTMVGLDDAAADALEALADAVLALDATSPPP